MNTWPYVPRVMKSLMPREYAVRVKVEGGHEASFAMVVNDRKNYVVLEQSAASRYQSRTDENEPGQI